MEYNQLDIYHASYDEVKTAVKQQYKNREWVSEHTGKVMTVKDWEEINKNLRADLKEMGVKCRGAFYNPNNMRVYIKQSFRTVRIGGLPQRVSSSEDYWLATGMDYCTDAEHFSVPAW